MHRFAAILASAAVFSSAQAQSFTNLDFEAANTASAVPPFGSLAWSAAAPGWQHGPGVDTEPVYYGLTHVGITQWYLLAGPGSSIAALAGDYSMSFASGYASYLPGAQWVNAYLAQTGVVPLGTRSLTLLATGPLDLQINGSSVVLVPTGAGSFAADVSAYAGATIEVRLVNASAQAQTPVTVDNIAFSTSPVPELPIWHLAGVGLLGLGIALSRRRTSQERAGDA